MLQERSFKWASACSRDSESRKSERTRRHEMPDAARRLMLPFLWVERSPAGREHRGHNSQPDTRQQATLAELSEQDTATKRPPDRRERERDLLVCSASVGMPVSKLSRH